MNPLEEQLDRIAERFSDGHSCADARPLTGKVGELFANIVRLATADLEVIELEHPLPRYVTVFDRAALLGFDMAPIPFAPGELLISVHVILWPRTPPAGAWNQAKRPDLEDPRTFGQWWWLPHVSPGLTSTYVVKKRTFRAQYRVTSRLGGRQAPVGPTAFMRQPEAEAFVAHEIRREVALAREALLGQIERGETLAWTREPVGGAWPVK